MKVPTFDEAMERRHLATIVSLAFAAFWAGLAMRGQEHLPVPWLLCTLFTVIAAGLAAKMRWTRWLGVLAAGVFAVLIPLGFVGAYFISLFGDQAMGFDMAIWFIAGEGLAVTLLLLLITLTRPTSRQGS